MPDNASKNSTKTTSVDSVLEVKEKLLLVGNFPTSVNVELF